MTGEHPESAHPWHSHRPHNHRISGPPITPVSYCPYCLNPGTTPDTAALREYRCKLGHTWLGTAEQAYECGKWVRAYKTGIERNV